jgi:TrmH family RNA methyltransferase
LFIAEGPKIVSELPPSTIKVESVYGIEAWVDEHRNIFENIKTEVIQVSPKELERISNLSTPNQVLALCKIPDRDIEDVGTGDSIVLALDGISDPGNMGTIIRTADWFGIHEIICSHDCVDLYNSKTIQATMGSFARVKVYYTELPEYLSRCEQEIIATVMEGDPIWDVKASRGIYIIGNESNGIRPEVLRHASRKVSIPARGAAESLNAAVAAGIVMAIATR